MSRPSRFIPVKETHFIRGLVGHRTGEDRCGKSRPQRDSIPTFQPVASNLTKTQNMMYKVVQIWPGLFLCKQVTACPGHIWTTLYLISSCSLLRNMDSILTRSLQFLLQTHSLSSFLLPVTSHFRDFTIFSFHFSYSFHSRAINMTTARWPTAQSVVSKKCHRHTSRSEKDEATHKTNTLSFRSHCATFSLPFPPLPINHLHFVPTFRFHNVTFILTPATLDSSTLRTIWRSASPSLRIQRTKSADYHVSREILIPLKSFSVGSDIPQSQGKIFPNGIPRRPRILRSEKGFAKKPHYNM